MSGIRKRYFCRDAKIFQSYKMDAAVDAYNRFRYSSLSGVLAAKSV